MATALTDVADGLNGDALRGAQAVGGDWRRWHCEESQCAHFGIAQPDTPQLT